MRERVERYQTKVNKFLKQIGRVRAYKRLFDTDDGKVVLADLTKSFNPFRCTFTDDARKSAYLDGQRSVVLSIIKVIGIKDEAIYNEISKLKNEKGGLNGRQSQHNTTRTGFFERRPTSE